MLNLPVCLLVSVRVFQRGDACHGAQERFFQSPKVVKNNVFDILNNLKKKKFLQFFSFGPSLY